MTALDEQIGGSHYKKYPIQPWKFCEINKLTGSQTAVIDYVMRHQDKNGLEDLLKARHHIDLMIEHYYPKEKVKSEDVTNILTSLEILNNRVSEIENQVCNLNEKVLVSPRRENEITDTERLDFMVNNELDINFNCDGLSVITDGEHIRYSFKSKNLRDAIDETIRNNDGN